VTNIGDQITTDELDGTNEAPHCLAIDATADDWNTVPLANACKYGHPVPRKHSTKSAGQKQWLRLYGAVTAGHTEVRNRRVPNINLANVMGIDDLEAIVQLLDRVRELSVATLSERQASHLFAGERTLLPLVVGFETNT
jgi:hypothetical protein